MSKFIQILFLGAPGVGKGTYARRIAPILEFGHVSPGDLLRQSTSSTPELSEYLANGTLVPEAVVFKLVNDKLAQLRTEKRGVILDGFPRSKEQARGWIERAKQQPPNLAVELKLPEELLVQKLLGRRTCSVCGDLYNVFSFQEGQYSMPAMLPKRDGKCDKCGGSLVKRVDDTISVIRDRLRSHWETERELIEYIRNNCGEVVVFDVKTGIAQVDELSLLIRHRLGLS